MTNRLLYDSEQMRVYDPLEPDLNKKKLGIGDYKNAMDIERKLGIGTTSVIRAINTKVQTYSKVLDKKVAIRLVRK